MAKVLCYINYYWQCHVVARSSFLLALSAPRSMELIGVVVTATGTQLLTVAIIKV